jgi:hypothetical protein
MAKIFKETLGGKLLLEYLDGIEEGRLPSPEDLKYKILLKVHTLRYLVNVRSKISRRTLTKHSQIQPQIPLNLERIPIP